MLDLSCCKEGTSPTPGQHKCFQCIHYYSRMTCQSSGTSPLDTMCNDSDHFHRRSDRTDHTSHMHHPS
eukprot:XP_001703843.1 Hypothetical protein GL50803_127013 [Giardia lamblia ATCC 50803]